ncbi:hypothetical protein PC114_g25580 [Phytophthora cactorum]|nr:hypothetical protein PC114_g25580 [Phytophthora cactorum]KAG3051097.1 hypothetical protein PC122_g23044 [Phytophthora cactorum]
MPPLHSRYHSFVNLLSSAHKDLRIMKFSLFIAALVGIAIQATDASTHLRVHILTELASAGQQCEWENKAAKCDSATFCQKSDKHTGYCMKKKPGLGDQCGGKGVDASVRSRRSKMSHYSASSISPRTLKPS